MSRLQSRVYKFFGLKTNEEKAREAETKVEKVFKAVAEQTKHGVHNFVKFSSWDMGAL
jgi:hypothetical protein